MGPKTCENQTQTNHDNINIKEFILSCLSENPIKVVWDCFSINKQSSPKKEKCSQILVQWGYFCYPDRYQYEFKNLRVKENPFYIKRQPKYLPRVSKINEHSQNNNNYDPIPKTLRKNKESYSNLFYYANKKIE